MILLFYQFFEKFCGIKWFTHTHTHTHTHIHTYIYIYIYIYIYMYECVCVWKPGSLATKKYIYLPSLFHIIFCVIGILENDNLDFLFKLKIAQKINPYFA